MTERKQLELAFEIARIHIFGEGGWRDSTKWCSECESYVPMITPFTAATLENTTVASIFRRLESGDLHHRTTTDGTLFTCLCSLLGDANICSEFQHQRQGIAN